MKKIIILIIVIFFNILITNAQSVSLGTSAVNPTKGTIIYENNTNLLKYWNGTAWISASGLGWVLNGNNVYNNNTGNVGVGTTTPSRKLEVNSGLNGESGLKLNKIQSTLDATDIATINSAIGFAKNNSLMFVSNFTGNQIYMIYSDLTTQLYLTNDLNGPHDLIIGPDNMLYAANFYGNNILKINFGSFTHSTFATGFNNPTGLTFDTNGNLYVCNYGNGTISKVTSSGVTTHNWATGLSSPYGCVFDPLTNQIFISNYGANEVSKVSVATGGAVSTFKASVSACTGITRNSLGDLFVAQAAPNKVSRITSDGNMSDYVTTTYPLDIFMDSGDILYVANQTLNKVTKYATNSLSSLLTINSIGDIKRTSLSKNGYKLHLGLDYPLNNGLYSESKTGIGVYSQSNSNYGVYGSSISNRGIFGQSSTQEGLYGLSNSGRGVYGQSTSNTGVYGISTSGTGIYGQSFSNDAIRGSSTSAYGVAGSSNSEAGVSGFSVTKQGVRGFSFSNIGVYGETGSVGIGVKGVSDFNLGIGVSGTSTLGTGVYGHSLSGFGIVGESANVGVKGISATYIGVSGNSTSGTAVHGYSESGYGVWGVSNGTDGRGVNGIATGFDGVGVYGKSTNGYAGQFDGSVKILKHLFVYGSFHEISDLRLKRDFIPLSSSLNKLINIKGYNYYWKDTTKSQTLQTGVIAQDLQKVFPELVNEEKDGYLSVNYIGLIPHLLEAVKELETKNVALQSKNEALEKLLKQLKADFSDRLEAIEASLKPSSGKQ